jgi:hypothetical protein
MRSHSAFTLWKLAGRQLRTEKPQVARGDYLRWLNASLFSLNLALLVIPVVSVRMKYPVLMIGQRIFSFVSSHWPFPIPWVVRIAEPNGLGFAALVLCSAGLFFVIFLMTARLQLVANFLRLVPGIVAVAGLPVVIKLLQGIPFALYVEVVAAAVCVLLYLYGRWRLPSLVSILMLGLHFAFWFWGTARVIWYWPVYPLIGFCSAVVWGIYVKQSEQSTNPRSRVEAKFA